MNRRRGEMTTAAEGGTDVGERTTQLLTVEQLLKGPAAANGGRDAGDLLSYG